MQTLRFTQTFVGVRVEEQVQSSSVQFKPVQASCVYECKWKNQECVEDDQ